MVIRRTGLVTDNEFRAGISDTLTEYFRPHPGTTADPAGFFFEGFIDLQHLTDAIYGHVVRVLQSPS